MNKQIALPDLIAGRRIWTDEETAYILSDYKIGKDAAGIYITAQLERVLPFPHIIPEDWIFRLVSEEEDEKKMVVKLDLFSTEPQEDTD